MPIVIVNVEPQTRPNIAIAGVWTAADASAIALGKYSLLRCIASKWKKYEVGSHRRYCLWPLTQIILHALPVPVNSLQQVTLCENCCPKWKEVHLGIRSCRIWALSKAGIIIVAHRRTSSLQLRPVAEKITSSCRPFYCYWINYVHIQPSVLLTKCLIDTAYCK